MLGILFVNNNDEWLASLVQGELHSTPGFSGGGLGCSLEQSNMVGGGGAVHCQGEGKEEGETMGGRLERKRERRER